MLGDKQSTQEGLSTPLDSVKWNMDWNVKCSDQKESVRYSKNKFIYVYNIGQPAHYATHKKVKELSSVLSSIRIAIKHKL